MYFGAKQPDTVENRWISTGFAGRWPEIEPKWLDFLDFQAVWPVNVAFSWPRGAEGYLPAGVSHRMEPRSPEADREVR